MTEESTLEMVMRHILEGERHVASQKGIVEKLERGGHNALVAKDLLAEFEKTIIRHREHLDRLVDKS